MGRLLWTPSQERIRGSNMFRFMDLLNKKLGLELTDYSALYQWSIDHLSDFWAFLWDFVEIKASTYEQGCFEQSGSFGLLREHFRTSRRLSPHHIYMG